MTVYTRRQNHKSTDGDHTLPTEPSTFPVNPSQAVEMESDSSDEEVLTITAIGDVRKTPISKPRPKTKGGEEAEQPPPVPVGGSVQTTFTEPRAKFRTMADCCKQLGGSDTPLNAVSIHIFGKKEIDWAQKHLPALVDHARECATTTPQIIHCSGRIQRMPPNEKSKDGQGAEFLDVFILPGEKFITPRRLEELFSVFYAENYPFGIDSTGNVGLGYYYLLDDTLSLARWARDPSTSSKCEGGWPLGTDEKDIKLYTQRGAALLHTTSPTWRKIDTALAHTTEGNAAALTLSNTVELVMTDMAGTRHHIRAGSTHPIEIYPGWRRAPFSMDQDQLHSVSTLKVQSVEEDESVTGEPYSLLPTLTKIAISTPSSAGAGGIKKRRLRKPAKITPLAATSTPPQVAAPAQGTIIARG